MEFEVIEIINYTGISENGREKRNLFGLKDHKEMIAANIGLFRFTYDFTEEKFKNCYKMWNEWTKDNKVLLNYED